jgi:hypothetical protein
MNTIYTNTMCVKLCVEHAHLGWVGARAHLGWVGAVSRARGCGVSTSVGWRLGFLAGERGEEEGVLSPPGEGAALPRRGAISGAGAGARGSPWMCLVYLPLCVLCRTLWTRIPNPRSKPWYDGRLAERDGVLHECELDVVTGS